MADVPTPGNIARMAATAPQSTARSIPNIVNPIAARIPWINETSTTPVATERIALANLVKITLSSLSGKGLIFEIKINPKFLIFFIRMLMNFMSLWPI